MAVIKPCGCFVQYSYFSTYSSVNRFLFYLHPFKVCLNVDKAEFSVSARVPVTKSCESHFVLSHLNDSDCWHWITLSLCKQWRMWEWKSSSTLRSLYKSCSFQDKHAKKKKPKAQKRTVQVVTPRGTRCGPHTWQRATYGMSGEKGRALATAIQSSQTDEWRNEHEAVILPLRLSGGHAYSYHCALTRSRLSGGHAYSYHCALTRSTQTVWWSSI